MLKLTAAFFVTLFSRGKQRHRKLMLVSEMGNDARDNGYHFFLYVLRHHPEIEVYYIISDDSPDRPRLTEYENHLVRYLSFRHCKLFCQAHWLVGTHLRSGHTPLPFELAKWLNRILHIFKHKKVVFLQHGITKNLQSRFAFGNTFFDLIICGAAPEADYFVEQFHYPPAIARYTGFCRYDKLLDFQVKRQLLLMPTWRGYIHLDQIADSQYFKTYQALLTEPRLASLLERYNIDLIFYPHHRFQPVVSKFKQGVTSSRIIIADVAHYDVQQLLKESALLITDYSSVFFDFTYMKKPVLFYQFDKDLFFSKHIGSGYVDESAFGPVAQDVDSLLSSLETYLYNGMLLEPSYETTVDRFFPIRDTHNCERVFDAVMNC
ncbi:MAG: CDP-glycerol glycerophosphotransferase family protein [Bacteroidales bacterium]|nr:CDP-glycerol glycerophosphotransferase family protein [Bacteroidales bacterium]